MQCLIFWRNDFVGKEGLGKQTEKDDKRVEKDDNEEEGFM